MNKEEKSSNKCPICGRPTHKESKYCIFHASAEEKTEEEFKNALKKYVNETKKKKKDFDFKRFIFIGNINFGQDFGIEIIYGASFKEVEFLNGNVSFENIKFTQDPKFINDKFLSGNVNFKNVTFEEKTSFSGVLFNGIVDFSKAYFRKEVEFKGTKFEGGPTSFREVVFCGDIFFEGNIFQNDIDFSNAGFKENFSFGFNKFNGSEINFNYADINKKFEIALNEKHYTHINLESITTYFGFVSLTLIVVNGYISFRNTLLEKISLCFEVYNNSYIDFEGARIKDTVLRRDHVEGYIIQENRKSYDKAKDIYISLKNNFHSIGRYDDESWAFKKEKEMERKGNRHFKTLHKWLWSCFLNGLFGYGEQPGKVIVSAILVIFLFASLFMIFGVSNVGIEFNTSNNFIDCMYFSTITFTTLGYGDFRPLEGWGRILAGSEAFIGAFMMALFVYTFARRTGGR